MCPKHGKTLVLRRHYVGGKGYCWCKDCPVSGCDYSEFVGEGER